MLHPCACGSLVEVKRIEPGKWLVKCRACSAMVLGDSEESVTVRWEENATVLEERDARTLKFTCGEVRDCCKDPRNLRFHSSQYDLKTYVCSVCHRRHRKMWAEPGVIGLKLGG